MRPAAQLRGESGGSNEASGSSTRWPCGSIGLPPTRHADGTGERGRAATIAPASRTVAPTPRAARAARARRGTGASRGWSGGETAEADEFASLSDRGAPLRLIRRWLMPARLSTPGPSAAAAQHAEAQRAAAAASDQPTAAKWPVDRKPNGSRRMARAGRRPPGHNVAVRSPRRDRGSRLRRVARSSACGGLVARENTARARGRSAKARVIGANFPDKWLQHGPP